MEKSFIDTSLHIDLNSNATSEVVDNAFNTKLRGDMGGRSKVTQKNEGDDMPNKLNRLRIENKKLIEMLMLLFETSNAMQRDMNMIQLMHNHDDDDEDDDEHYTRSSIATNNNKRKCQDDDDHQHHHKCVCCNNDNGENNNNHLQWLLASPTTPRELNHNTNVSKAYYKADPSDTTLVVKDGYQWRKYGQKVTRDNPSPRAYYKCSLAPTCPVKKKVQRSLGDPSVLEVTYEGRHNHHRVCDRDREHGYDSPRKRLNNSTVNNVQKPASVEEVTMMKSDDETQQHLLVEQIASSLTRNSSFTSALAYALSSRIFDLEQNV